LRRRGAVLVWGEDEPDASLQQLRTNFGDFEVQPVLVLPRQSWHPGRPDRVVYAFVPPLP